MKRQIKIFAAWSLSIIVGASILYGSYLIKAKVCEGAKNFWACVLIR